MNFNAEDEVAMACRYFAIGLVILVSSTLTAQQTVSPDTRCVQLTGHMIPATAIGLPSRGATITSASLIVASQQNVNRDGTFTPAMPEYCRVLGAIAPVDPAAPDINVQVNLPTDWNGKALQYGGAGFNGTLVTGLGAVPSAPPNVPRPLVQGYVTFGTDSGHQAAALAEVQAFALNDEALINFAYAAYKKTRDVAVEVMKARYGRMPSRTYYAGSSEGGREGLTMAQRFPQDYDGVISRVPVVNWVGLQHAGLRTGLMHGNGGWLNEAEVSLVQKAVLAVCDDLDNLADGVVSNYEACREQFRASVLRCPAGVDRGDTCLTDTQISAVETLHSPYTFRFPLAHGVTSYPAFGYGGEAQQGGFLQWVTGREPASVHTQPSDTSAQQWRYGSGMVRYFVARDPMFDASRYSPNDHQNRIRQVSELMDSTDPDLSKFHARSGKLLLMEHMADYAQSPYAGIEYYKSVVAKMGQQGVDQFVRLYVAPGANHNGAGVSTTGRAIPQYVDLLAALDAWVERATVPPESLVQTSQDTTPPFAVLGSRPLCRYPSYPKYNGSGDPNTATSHSCVNR